MFIRVLVPHVFHSPLSCLRVPDTAGMFCIFHALWLCDLAHFIFSQPSNYYPCFQVWLTQKRRPRRRPRKTRSKLGIPLAENRQDRFGSYYQLTESLFVAAKSRAFHFPSILLTSLLRPLRLLERFLGFVCISNLENGSTF